MFIKITKMPFDTIPQLDTVYIKGADAYDLLNKVDSFYQTAWGHLMLFGSIALGLMGIIFPLILEFFKWRQYKIDRQNFREILNKDFEEIKREIIKENDEKLAAKFKEVDAEVKLVEHRGKAGIYFLQGRLRLDNGDSFQALPNLLTSMKSSMSCGDTANVISALQLIRMECLPMMSEEGLAIIKKTYNMDLEAFLSELTNSDKNGLLSYEIGQIRIMLTKMPKTQEELGKLIEAAKAALANQKTGKRAP